MFHVSQKVFRVKCLLWLWKKEGVKEMLFEMKMFWLLNRKYEVSQGIRELGYLKEELSMEIEELCRRKRLG